MLYQWKRNNKLRVLYLYLYPSLHVQNQVWKHSSTITQLAAKQSMYVQLCTNVAVLHLSLKPKLIGTHENLEPQNQIHSMKLTCLVHMVVMQCHNYTKLFNIKFIAYANYLVFKIIHSKIFTHAITINVIKLEEVYKQASTIYKVLLASCVIGD